jgi:hypothetical protein
MPQLSSVVAATKYLLLLHQSNDSHFVTGTTFLLLVYQSNVIFIVVATIYLLLHQQTSNLHIAPVATLLSFSNYCILLYQQYIYCSCSNFT